jgi:hypothetical protein
MESRGARPAHSQAFIWPGGDARRSTGICCFTIVVWAFSAILRSRWR